ncbi:hypothetical protein CLAFUW4_04902 [Fulvia fulva]|uniref:Non-homologous end-joining factor 1 n=1 Tax=Passalora fulva TaxID=5499 RepID=A0A9Q8PIB0_PASFU|nr:uncharacterized protein CLAFUR5_12003 [Fulvia fulva]KAK4626448.1 hypothetical protein CLAFUR4_04888 [Fulvia fulva]KAK4628158.1 hypothetical protein CLAFUR0_04892 [Fulvia fulva]UJO23010.1 hypothetical protein CLAFUR5_12003 [Fulvia fulva]WPV14034.1 hypothetical protein CLAFUW4_04902 [Fulvia fulva]WPV28779.1 hypothetical protein CLAFUW7_04896 [Fulvia fulva]
MAGVSTWKLLEFGQELPRLLIKTRFKDNGYNIQLTDLSRIWSESLEHEDIVKRAAEEGCSIDPSENDQYQILLEKIDGAISGDKGSTIELRYDDEQHNSLSLDLSAPLPGSLPTLSWSIQLKQRDQSDIAKDLVTPLLQQANHLRHQVQFLVDEVVAKDRVIAKITDRLESSGNDLTTVFPGVSNIKTNRKRPQREQLAGHVKGLADFDEETWRASIAPKIDHFEVSPNLLNDLLSDLPAPDSSDFNESANGEWWKRLQHGNCGKIQHESHVVGDEAGKSRRSDSAQAKLSVNRSTEDKDFRKQDTPPHLSHRSHSRNRSTATSQDSDAAPRIAPVALADDEETENEDDLDAVPSRTSSSQTNGRLQQAASQKSAIGSNTPPSKRTAKLGAIGGKRQKSASPEPAQVQRHESPHPSTREKTKLGAFGGKKKRSVTPETDDEEPIKTPPKRKPRLGVFGGPSKECTSATEGQGLQERRLPTKNKKLGTFGGKGQGSIQRDETTEQAVSSTTSPAQRKLGTIGGRASTRTVESLPPAAQKVEEVDQDEKLSEEPEVDETPEERANRKRELLRKEMQEKHPVKKKRKF